MDRGDGLLGGLIRSGERAEGDAKRGRVGGFDCPVCDARGDEAHGDLGVGGPASVVFAGDGEVERVAVVGFAVDFDGVGSVHILSVY